MAETVKSAPPQQAKPADPDDPWEDGVGYLKARGWKCLGSVNGRGWIDPTCPPAPTYRKVKRQAPNWKTGIPEDVVADDGTGRKVVVEQFVFDSPAEPMTIQEAIQIQMGRDRREREKALGAQAAEAPRKTA